MIPVLLNFFQVIFILVKWNKELSFIQTVNGGGPHGGTAGILEYISKTNGNLSF